MKYAIRYYSRGGNTEKLAKKIEEIIGVEAKTVEEPLNEDVDILFLGSSVYAAGVDTSIKNFVSGINVNVGKVVNFSTAAIIESTYNQVKKLVEEKGIRMSDKEFHCKGSFSFVHRGRPNDKDLDKLSEFVSKIVESE